ncbi:MAG: hypothetical protein ACLQGP_21430 [Isosphaeraceae bacterium]
MSVYRVTWAPGLLALMLITGFDAGASADDTPAEPALAKLGLKQTGPLVVLEAESDVHSKTTEARQLYRDWSNAVMRQRSTVSEKEYQSTIKGLNDETNALKRELNTTNQMINQLPKYRGRFTTNLGAQQNYDLNLYKTQLQGEISQRTMFLNQLRSQPFDPKAKLKMDVEVREKSQAMNQAVQELRKLVDETHDKYKGLEKNDEVKKLLSTIERKTGTPVKLGQSRQYKLDLKYLDKLEEQVSPGESGSSTSKPAKKGRRTTKTKRYRSTDSEDFDGPF